MPPAAFAAKVLAAAWAVTAWAAPASLPGGLTGEAPAGWVAAVSEPDQTVWTRPSSAAGYAPTIALERRDGGRREAAAFERRTRARAQPQKAAAAGLTGRRWRATARTDSAGEHGGGRGKIAVTTETLLLPRAADFLVITFSAPAAEFARRRPDFDAFVSGLRAR